MEVAGEVGMRGNRWWEDTDSGTLTCGIRNNQQSNPLFHSFKVPIFSFPKPRTLLAWLLLMCLLSICSSFRHTQSYHDHNSTPEHSFHLHLSYWFEWLDKFSGRLPVRKA